MKIRIGVVIIFMALFALCFIFISENFTFIERVVSFTLCFGIISFGLLIEKNFFPRYKEAFDNERKF